jgi:hypothetical protein
MFVAFVLIHFFGTWLSSLAGWSHDRAFRISQILWEPCGRFVSVLPAGKTSVMFALLCSSLVWATAALLLLLSARSLLRFRRSTQ